MKVKRNKSKQLCYGQTKEKDDWWRDLGGGIKEEMGKEHNEEE
jgi:hypothetical protein